MNELEPQAIRREVDFDVPDDYETTVSSEPEHMVIIARVEGERVPFKIEGGWMHRENFDGDGPDFEEVTFEQVVEGEWDAFRVMRLVEVDDYGIEDWEPLRVCYAEGKDYPIVMGHTDLQQAREVVRDCVALLAAGLDPNRRLTLR